MTHNDDDSFILPFLQGAQGGTLGLSSHKAIAAGTPGLLLTSQSMHLHVKIGAL